MKAAETLIAWTPLDPNDICGESRMPPGSIGIGPLIEPGHRDWTDRAFLNPQTGQWVSYPCTGGAAYSYRRTLPPAAQRAEVMREARQLVRNHGLNPYLVHRAFSLIDEYQPARNQQQIPIRCVEVGGAFHFMPEKNYASQL